MNKYLLMFLTPLMMTQTGVAQGPPTFTDTPIFLGLEGRGVRTFVRYISRQNARVFIVPVVVPYNLKTNILVGGLLPFLRKSPDALSSQTGIGDVSLFVKYLLFQRNRIAETFRLALKFQETFPTGNSDAAPSPGLGVYQSYLGIIGGYITTKFGVYTELGYNAVSERFNDHIVYNVSLGVPLLPVTYPPEQINLYVEFNGSSWIAESKTILFFSPAMQVIPHKRFLLEGGVQIPIREDVLQSHRTNIVFTVGTRILIF